MERLVVLVLLASVAIAARPGGAPRGPRAGAQGGRVLEDAVDGRALLVRLPDGYDDSAGPFPVVYVHDGASVLGRIGETADRLEREGTLHRIVVVGIAASGDREAEYLPYTIERFRGREGSLAGRGAEYAKWVVDRVVPHVESKYKVARDRRDRAVLGSSFAGVLAVWSAIHQSDVFSFAAALSPPPVEALVADVVASPKRGTRVWIDSGERESIDGTSFAEGSRELVAALGRKGRRYGRELAYLELAGDVDTSAAGIAGRAAYPLVLFTGRKAAELLGVDVEVGRVGPRAAPGSRYVNAVASFSDGLRYSLYDVAEYSISGAGRATVTGTGVLSLNGDPSATVTVKFGDVERTARVTASALGPAPGTAVSAGTLVRYGLFDSQHVGPRTVDVWLPPGYRERRGARYPVLYMHDGQNLFDASIAYAGEWGVDEALSRLAARRQVRPAIVVGVWNTSRRFSDYMPRKAYDLASPEAQAEMRSRGVMGEPESDGYVRFLVEELKPFVDATYRTLTGRDDTFVMGSSMGGLISLYAICERPDVFGGAACVSTHWPAGRGAVVEYLKTAAPDPATHRVYFDFGTEGLDAQYEPYQLRADEAMRAGGFVDGRNWVTRKFPGADHNERSWRERLDLPLRFLLSPRAAKRR